jgi:hypothetical protein
MSQNRRHDFEWHLAHRYELDNETRMFICGVSETVPERGILANVAGGLAALSRRKRASISDWSVKRPPSEAVALPGVRVPLARILTSHADGRWGRVQPAEEDVRRHMATVHRSNVEHVYPLYVL